MKKRNIILIILAVIVIAVLILVFIKPKPTGNSALAPTVAITYQNIASVVGGSSIVGSLPKDSKLLLKFYNFNSGERAWEKSYVLTSGSMKETTNSNEEAEIVLLLDSKYLNGLTNNNFCSMIQQANNNGDLGFETDMSAAALAWKFKAMYKYRDCFGF